MLNRIRRVPRRAKALVRHCDARQHQSDDRQVTRFRHLERITHSAPLLPNTLVVDKEKVDLVFRLSGGAQRRARQSGTGGREILKLE
jgi:hypothetical protein